MLKSLITFALIAIISASDPPSWQDKAGVARWLAHQASYGVLSTTSTAFDGVAFGNPQSFADGTSDNSTGHLYFYVSHLDQSMIDIAANPRCSFTLTEAETSYCSKNNIDPEDPTCARLTFVGKFRNVTNAELPHAQAALFERHPAMRDWAKQGDFHAFHFTTIDMESIWLIDMYGGASNIDVDKYYQAKP